MAEESTNIEKVILDEIESTEEHSTGTPLIGRDMDLVGHVDVSVSVNVGHVEISLDKLFSLKPGDSLALVEKVDSPITLYVAGKPVAKGNLVAVGDNFGVQITEVE